MSNFKIENKVPLAPRRNSRRIAYPFEDMKIGDSFFVEDRIAPPHLVRMAAIYFAKKKKDGRRFSVRMENGGCRVWRVRS